MFKKNPGLQLLVPGIAPILIRLLRLRANGFGG